ncbi:MAG: hypothetical protein GF417_11950, partial [Candidatus Latescibacteria bacterium]|nr:hypothetical protein [bacterium]MBD3425139.1 hypothetical protein [Candidatus Latescibacterota bacterium]
MRKITVKMFHELTGTVVISVIAGTMGAGLVRLFMIGLEYISSGITRVGIIPQYLIPLAGAFIAGLGILRFFPGAGGDGTNDYIDSVNRQGGRFRMADTLAKIPATLITLGMYGSGGIVGTLSRIGSGLSSAICAGAVSTFRIKHDDTFRIAAVCG